jgi:hypothetical protein
MQNQWGVLMELQVKKSFSSSEYHYVFGEVYAPHQVDTDGEIMTAGDIQSLAHGFIAGGETRIDINHNHIPADGVEVVESFIARKDDTDYREGAWVLGLRMKEGQVWDAIKSGELNGFSFEASVKKIKKKVLVEIDKISAGDTELSSSYEPEIPPHKHSFYVEYGEDGRITFGTTSEAEGHTHKLAGNVVTERAVGHVHRYFTE